MGTQGEQQRPPPVATPASLGLRARLAPVSDRRVASALATTVLAYAGLFAVYSYIAVVFHRTTGGNGRTLAARHEPQLQPAAQPVAQS